MLKGENEKMQDKANKQFLAFVVSNKKSDEEMLRLKTMHLREGRKERKREELKNCYEKLHSEIKYIA